MRYNELNEGLLLGAIPVIAPIDWSEGAYIPPSRKKKYTKDLPWYTVEDYPDYECRYHPYSVLTVRKKSSKVECIQRMWDFMSPSMGKYVNVWKNGRRVRVDINAFQKYRTNNKKGKG